MGRFRAKSIVVRRVNDLTIVFYNKETIYVTDDAHKWTIFHRWYAPLGFYGKNWKPFRRLLRVEKEITFNHCYRLAFKYDIQSMANVKPPNLHSKHVVELIV